MELTEHEANSESRYHDIKRHLHKLHTESTQSKDVNMSTQPVNIFESQAGSGMGAAMGGGLGAGVLGGVLGGALFGGNGFGGRNNTEGVVTPSQLQASIGSVIDSNQNTTILQSIGQVKEAAIAAGAQTNLAISTTASDIRAHLGQVENSLNAGQMAINKNVSDAIASSLASQNNINMNVLQSAAATREAVNLNGTSNLIATKDAQYALAAAVVADGEKTRAMLVAQNEAGLRTEITALQIRLQEQRSDALARGTEVNVTQTVNQNQQQMQLQAQQQQQAILLNNIWSQMAGMQQAIATNSNMIIGNSGAVATGPNTANPVNVRT